MSDDIKHECAIAMVKLRKEQSHFEKRYGEKAWGARKLAILLEKQHNRGQDGAGAARLVANPVPGTPPYEVVKSAGAAPLTDILSEIGSRDFSGSAWLGHLRYATFGRNDIGFCHPFVKDSPVLDRIMLLAGNFNLTDNRDIFDRLVATGHHPASQSDGYLILQLFGHYLETARSWGVKDLAANVLAPAVRNLDGGYALCGLLGDGTAFALRDPAGIRPCYYYFNEEVVAVASERPAIQTTFNCATSDVCELPPGSAIIVSPDGKFSISSVVPPAEKRACVFERIYFSRASDADIHRERRALGRALVPAILNAVEHDFENTFFSYIPNTAQVGFHGMLAEMCERALAEKCTVRFGQIAVKDAKFRTFIADAALRSDLHIHVYDVTYGLVRPGSDTLVVLDDSIVRGNTMRGAILPILDRLGPKMIVLGSTAPILKYPDCYGIDMATLHELVAFEALMDLIRARGKEALIAEAKAEAEAVTSGKLPPNVNPVRRLYAAFSDAELTAAIAARLRPQGFRAELRLVYQTCDALRECCPDHTGDWCFTGDYPTPGGYRTVSRAFLNYLDNKHERSYE